MMDVMTDDTEDEPPSKPRRPVSARPPHLVDMGAILADQEKRMTAGERAFRDVQRGINPFPESSAEKAIREVKLGLSVPEPYFKSALPKGFLTGINASVSSAVAPMVKSIHASAFASMEPVFKSINASALASMEPVFKSINATALAAMAPTIKGINASTLASMEPVFRGINASLLASTAPIFKDFDASGVASAAHLAASGMFPKNFPQALLPTSTLSAMQAASMFAKRADFGAMTDQPAGVLGRFDSALHADLGLGAAADSLIAAPTRRGSVGFDYGSVQRCARAVDDVLADSSAGDDLAEAVEEAQDATGLHEDLMLDLSQFLGIPASRRPGAASAAKILFIATIGSSVVVLDFAAGHLAPSGLLVALLLGRDAWNWLTEGRKRE